MLKRNISKAFQSIASGSALPKLVAGLSVAIAVVKLLAAVDEYKQTKSAGKSIGFR